MVDAGPEHHDEPAEVASGRQQRLTAIYDNPATAGINNPTGRWRAQGTISQFNLGNLPGTGGYA